MPDLTFGDELVLDLGVERIRLRYHGPNNGRGSVSVHFEEAGVLHVVDWIVLGRMPCRDLQGYDIHGMIRSTREVQDVPGWDVLVGGHAEVGGRDVVDRYLTYLEDLYAHVRAGTRAGKPLEQIQAEAHFAAYADVVMYEEWLPLNVAGVYRTLVDASYLLMRPDVPSPEDE